MLYGSVMQMPVGKTRFRSVMSAFANAEYSLICFTTCLFLLKALNKMDKNGCQVGVEIGLSRTLGYQVR